MTNDTPALKCGKCGSTRIALGVRAEVEAGHGVIQLVVDRHPAALVFKGAARFDLRARVCGACGVVEFYAKDAASVYDAAEQSRSQPDR